MKEYVLFDPTQVGLFGADAVVPDANEFYDGIDFRFENGVLVRIGIPGK